MYTNLYAFTEILLFSLEHGDVQTRGLNSAITSAAGKATATTRTSTPPTATATTSTTTAKLTASSTTNPTAATDATNAASAAGNINYSQISIYLYVLVSIC